jgi:hypothetical protein
MEYANLDLVFEKRGGSVEVRVAAGPSGESAPQAFEVPFDYRDLENFVLKMQSRRATVRGGRIDSPESEQAKRLGGDLFGAVFRGDIKMSLRRSLDAVRHDGKGLRVRLQLSETPELLNMPWELLYDAEDKRFLALFTATPIVRYLSLSRPPQSLKVSLPLRILVMVSNPRRSDYQPLNVEKERRLLRSAVKRVHDPSRVEVQFIQARLPALQKALQNGPFHVFHFIGHAGFDAASQDGVLVLESPEGYARETGGEVLGPYLADHPTMQLVVLNACEGSRTSNDDPYAGVAQTLVQQGIPAVIAMQFEISDSAAVTFSQELYGALIGGGAVDESLCEARKAVYGQPNVTEWATPVLYMRSPDGALFDLQAQVPVGESAKGTESSETKVVEVSPPVEKSVRKPAVTKRAAPRRGTSASSEARRVEKPVKKAGVTKRAAPRRGTSASSEARRVEKPVKKAGVTKRAAPKRTTSARSEPGPVENPMNNAAVNRLLEEQFKVAPSIRGTWKYEDDVFTHWLVFAPEGLLAPVGSFTSFDTPRLNPSQKMNIVTGTWTVFGHHLSLSTPQVVRRWGRTGQKMREQFGEFEGGDTLKLGGRVYRRSAPSTE